MNSTKEQLGYTMYTPNEMQMNSKVQTWGNSLGLRIPKYIAEKMNFKPGVSISIELEKNRIIIRPEKEESLEEMVKKINKNNMHENIFDFDPVGKEVW